MTGRHTKEFLQTGRHKKSRSYSLPNLNVKYGAVGAIVFALMGNGFVPSQPPAKFQLTPVSVVEPYVDNTYYAEDLQFAVIVPPPPPVVKPVIKPVVKKATPKPRATTKASRSTTRKAVAPLSNPGNVSGAAVISFAKNYLGTPYRYGGTTPNGFDCSGFLVYVFKHFGIRLPRTSSQIASAGVGVSISNMKPGDILWRPGHVGLYIGGGKMIHSPKTGDVVKIADTGPISKVRRVL